MVLPQFVLNIFALISLLLGMVSVYYDIKNRSIETYLFIIISVFAIIEFLVFAIFQFSIILVIPAILIILASLYSYYTGNVGFGDLPIIAFILIFIFNIGHLLSYLMIFSVAFILSLFAMPFILYRKVLTNFEKIAVYLSIIITTIIIFVKIMFGIIILFITIGFLLYMLLKKKEEMYKITVKYMTKNDIIIGDLIINSLLDQETRNKLGIVKTDKLTNINDKIMDKIDDRMKLPIYSNSIPFTIPLMVGFICVLIAFFVML